MSKQIDQAGDDDEFTLVESPLSQRVTRDGVSVDVEIYGNGAGQWILEVVDAQNTSHVWNEHFATDQLALDEALRTIDEDGIDSLSSPEPDLD